MSEDTRKKTKHTIRDVFILALAGLISITALYLIVARATGNIPFLFNYTIAKIATPSMEPKIMAGDFILVRKAAADDVRIDDIIMFYSDDSAIAGNPNTHRVKKILHSADGVTEFVTKGDNNPVNDSVTAKGQKLIGVYVTGLPVITAIMRFFTNQWAFLLLVVIPAAVIFIMCLKEFGKKAKEARMEKMIQAEVQRLKDENDHKKDSGNDMEKGE